MPSKNKSVVYVDKRVFLRLRREAAKRRLTPAQLVEQLIGKELGPEEETPPDLADATRMLDLGPTD